MGTNYNINFYIVNRKDKLQMSKIQVNDLTNGKRIQKIKNIPFGTFFYCKTDELTLISELVLKLEDTCLVFKDYQSDNATLRIYKYAENQIVYYYTPVNVSINTWRDR